MKVEISRGRRFLSFAVLFILVIGSAVYFFQHTHGQEMEHLNVKYGDDPKQSLDVYSPTVGKGKKLPVILYVHGGGWTGGDKSNVAEKPSFFTNKGYVFVSVNHRLSPKASYVEMANDVSSAVKWVYDNADTYQIDRSKINLMGHSAGGQLVMLVGTNPEYLNKVGLTPQSLKSIVSLEGPLDLTDFIQRMSSYKKVFGNDQQVWAEASPLTYAANKSLPPMFLVAHGTRSIAAFVDSAKKAGNTVDSFTVQTLSHSGVTEYLGSSKGSEEAKNMTNAVVAFLKKNNS
jgi:acetyl esterase/lipase